MNTPNTTISLTGLTLGSAQSLGAFRLVPVLRERAPGDLRIASRRHDSFGVVRLGGRPGSDDGLHYTAYVPHGLIVTHSTDRATVARGTALGREAPALVTVHHRLVKSEVAPGPNERRLRVLPLHLAFEGFLAQHFRGPEILWPEYSRLAHRHGLDPRVEHATRGAWLHGFEDALRLFEIDERQVGMLVFVSGALASATVVSHPSDYRALHLSLLEDFFGELLYHHAFLSQAPLQNAFDIGAVHDLASLRVEVERVRTEDAGTSLALAAGLLERPVCTEVVRTTKPFVLERFLPTFDPREECHLGERIVRDDGTLEYLKTFRLSQAQVRRAFLLEQLAACEWQLDAVLATLGCTLHELVIRLRNAGFGYLLHPTILRGYRHP